MDMQFYLILDIYSILLAYSRKDEPMKLTTITNVSVDGVMQGLGGSDEDRRG
jgi:hypothetical protein